MVSTGGVLENPYNTGPGPDAFISSTYYKPTKITTHHSKKYYKKKRVQKGANHLYRLHKNGARLQKKRTIRAEV